MLTNKQNMVLGVIREFIRENQRQPTLEEIGYKLGIGRSTVHKHVQALIRAGNLFESSGKFAYEYVDEDDELGSLPYLGRIAAGKPIEAIIDQKQINLARFFCGAGRYVLKISGDSMIGAGIFDEDYVVIRKQETARPGTIVVALVEGREATLKYYHPHSTGVVELKPANNQLKTMYYPADQVEIQGVLIGVFRDYQAVA
ncbi:transcriptional repressor LexA [Leucothrix pacifica]|uniref:Repressor LexA n=1 Tax=Leucothrix pacifica TaxID=1247513 RepID=A0A317C363_9GAMM|nr:transcriptional repressor LexA [Leucothrix pacifica]PWQ93064.1 repressor LexA [Leucothrix pacifica]